MASAAIEPEVELLYFDIAGKAEAIRLACAYGGVALKDTRIRREDFTAPQGAAPTQRGLSTLSPSCQISQVT